MMTLRAPRGVTNIGGANVYAAKFATTSQVSKAFAKIFTKLVPQGSGRLVIQRKADRRGEDEDSEEEGARRSSVEAYAGVGISVSFNSKHDDQQKIQQLSGGQKSES